MTIYELTAEYAAVLAMASDPEVDPQAITDTLEAISGEIELKAENTAKVLKQLESDAAALKAEAERLTERRKVIENNISSIKERLYCAMKSTGKEKFKTPLFSFSIAKNPVKLVIDNESAIPKKYYVPQPAKLNAAQLRDDLKAGAVRKYAHLEQSERVNIR